MVGGKHVDDFILKSGDTMTGPLTLPVNGLLVGINQLVGGGRRSGVVIPQCFFHVPKLQLGNEIIRLGAGKEVVKDSAQQLQIETLVERLARIETLLQAK